MDDTNKALVAAMKDQTESWEFEDPREDWWRWQHEYAQAADRIEALSAENERLRDILEQWLETAREHLDTEVAGRTFEALRATK